VYKQFFEKANEYESMVAEDFVFDQENYDKWHLYQNDKIGRYPYGFRHFENFANYSQAKRDSTIQEYMELMNRPCEFHDYLAIIRSHLIEESNTPEFKHEWKLEVLGDLYREMGMNVDRDDQEMDFTGVDVDDLQIDDTGIKNM
jgi:hypothetical protein